MRRGSLRLRLFAAGAASILIALTIAGIGLLLLFERHVERRMVLELEAHLRQLVSGLDRSPDGSLEVARPPAEPRFLEPLSGLYWQIAVGAERTSPALTLALGREFSIYLRTVSGTQTCISTRFRAPAPRPFSRSNAPSRCPRISAAPACAPPSPSTAPSCMRPAGLSRPI